MSPFWFFTFLQYHASCLSLLLFIFRTTISSIHKKVHAIMIRIEYKDKSEPIITISNTSIHNIKHLHILFYVIQNFIFLVQLLLNLYFENCLYKFKYFLICDHTQKYYLYSWFCEEGPYMVLGIKPRLTT